MKIGVTVIYNNWGIRLTHELVYTFSLDRNKKYTREEELNIIKKYVPLQLVHSFSFSYPQFIDIEVGDYVNVCEYNDQGVQKVKVTEKQNQYFILENRMEVTYEGKITTPHYNKLYIEKC